MTLRFLRLGVVLQHHRSWWVLGLLLTTLASVADGAKYRQLRDDPTLLKRDRSFVTAVLLGRETLDSPEREKRFDTFYKRGLFAGMTQLDSVGELAQRRRDFLTQYLRRARDPAILRRVNGLALKAMAYLIRSNDFHPAVRFNAILILGQLDRIPAVEVGVEKRPPTPLPEALPVLFRFFNAEKMPDAIKVGALLGILRHARYGVIDDRDGIHAAKLLALLRADTPPPDRDPDAHVWMRRRAAEILGTMGQSGGNPQVVAALVALLGDRQTTLELRCTAASALGRLKVQSSTNTDPNVLAAGLAKLAFDVCELENEAITNRQELPSKRRVGYRLKAVAQGLAALEKIGTARHQAMAARVQTLVEETLEQFRRSNYTNEILQQDMQQLTTQVRTAITGKAASAAVRTAPAAAQPAAVDDADPFESL